MDSTNLPQTGFLNPEKALVITGLTHGMTVADLGAGSGFYAIAAGKIVGPQGQVYVVDILEPALEHLHSEARVHGIRNIQTIRADLENSNACDSIPEGKTDLVVVANVLHQVQKKQNIFTHAYRLLKTGGKLLVIDWNDSLSPIGPEHGTRISETEVKKLAEKSFKFADRIATDKYHYGLMFTK